MNQKKITTSLSFISNLDIGFAYGIPQVQAIQQQKNK